MYTQICTYVALAVASFELFDLQRHYTIQLRTTFHVQTQRMKILLHASSVLALSGTLTRICTCTSVLLSPVCTWMEGWGGGGGLLLTSLLSFLLSIFLG